MPVVEDELPSTNEEGEIPLPGGDSVHPDLYRDLEAKLYEHEGGDEGWRNRLNVGKNDPITPFTASKSISIKNIAGARHRERSEAAQEADEAFNAPIAPDYATWRANPNRYDLPGVDTIPDERYAERADRYLSKARDAGAVEKVLEGSIEDDDSTRGQFVSAARGVLTKRRETLEEENRRYFRYGPVIAHEVGHAVDYARARIEGLDQEFDGKYYGEWMAGHPDIEVARGAEEDPESDDDRYEVGKDWTLNEPDERPSPDVLGELRDLSARARGDVKGEYRQGMREIVADALGLRALEPRAVQREAPKAAAWLDDLANPVLGGPD